MKKIKFFISLFLAIIITCIPTIIRPNVTDDVMPLNLHTLHTVTSFGFVDHHARVNVDFMGYEDTAKLRVDVKIEKQNFLFFRETVISESYSAQGESYQNEFFYPIYKDGIYDCTVTYTVTGDNGEDLITFADTQTYRFSDHAEHTHVWNRERTEPTYQKEGLEIKFCYCGKSENTVLEKLTSDNHPNQFNTNSDFGAVGSFIQSAGAPKPNQTNQSASLNQPFNGFSGTQSQSCSCPFCKLADALPNPQPPTPTVPSVPTNDPWKKQQEAYMNRNYNLNPYHINPYYLK